MNSTVIDVQNLTRRFGDLVAVRNVSFQVPRGSIFGLLGPNGSGKSTIIRMLLGILPPSDGKASLLGHDAYQESEVVKPRVGYMSQKFSLYADLSVRENVDFYGRIYGLDRDALERRRKAVLDLTSLTDNVHQLAGTLTTSLRRPRWESDARPPASTARLVKERTIAYLTHLTSEHRRLREQLDQIEREWIEKEFPQLAKAMPRVIEGLERLRAELAHHFAEEESGAAWRKQFRGSPT